MAVSSKRITTAEYMCAYCGSRQNRQISIGKPQPGRCPKRTNGQPHRWILNRKY